MYIPIAPFLTDFYKIGHRRQYPSGTKDVFANWTARYGRNHDITHVTWFGMQYFLMRVLDEFWDEGFFGLALTTVISEYRLMMKGALGDPNPETSHIEALHRKGFLPIEIWSLPEGSSVPYGVPMAVIHATDPDFFWLPNFIETIMSAYLWLPSTSATTAGRYRSMFTKWAKAAGETDLSFIDWQGHDFSFRGMGGLDDATLSGMGHLAVFRGTDTIPAIDALVHYYGADYSCGGSIPATEHSVMCAGGQESEQETFRRLIEDVYPNGPLSIVSDTWDLYHVLTSIIPALKDKILARDGKIVIRPDSGDPVKILCGDSASENLCAKAGAIRLLAHALGTVPGSGKLPQIDHGGLIYGDAITVDRADAILKGTVEDIGLSPYVNVFGIGSYTYRHVTRDEHGKALKSTAVTIADGTTIGIMKSPVTDQADSSKRSLCGIPIVKQDATTSEFFVTTSLKPDDLKTSAMQVVYKDGSMLIETSLDDVRALIRENLK